MRVKQRTLPLSDSWFARLFPPRARTPAHRCRWFILARHYTAVCLRRPHCVHQRFDGAGWRL